MQLQIRCLNAFVRAQERSNLRGRIGSERLHGDDRLLLVKVRPIADIATQKRPNSNPRRREARECSDPKSPAWAPVICYGPDDRCADGRSAERESDAQRHHAAAH